MGRHLSLLLAAAALSACPSTPPGQTCAVNADCADTAACVQSKCTPKDCPNEDCLDKQACVNDACVDRLCVGVSCTGDSVCANGDCLPLRCSAGDCAPGRACAAEQCVELRCYGVICPGSTVCVDGLCQPADCANQSCGPREACLADVCQDATCYGVICPGGLSCVQGLCIGPTCTDGFKDGAETDVDCGGGSCMRCGADAGCTQASDCQSDVCAGQRCTPGACSDLLRNGQETDVDCGGPTCPDCGDGKMCSSGADCRSGQCPSGTCLATCSDGQRNNSETDVDCGGPFCPRCGTDGGCTNTFDCQSGMCVGTRCQPGSCTDGWRNGTETDVDCGGSCPPCAGGSRCFGSTDCLGGLCLDAGTPADGGVCTGPTCSDGVKTDAGLETDVDCGGGRCRPCLNTLGCNVNTDCQYRLCNVGACAAFTVTLPRWSPPDSVTRYCSTGACADAGEDGDFYAPVPTYTATADTVHDSVTNLTWQRNHHPNPQTWQQAWERCDGLNLDGYTDWRLPSRGELFTINDLGRAGVPVDAALFPGVGIIQTFWTSGIDYTSPSTYSAFGLLYRGLSGPPVRFIRGYAAGPAASQTNLARCVRAPLVAYPAQRFNPYAGSQGDTITRLQWQEPTSASTFTWAAARAYCEGLNLDGLGDWRLPSVKELDTIAREFAPSGPVIESVFVNAPVTVWSSTAVPGSAQAYVYLYTAGGGPTLDENGVGTANRVRCVRGPN